MPIKSYLAYPVRGRSDELAAALRRLSGCQVFAAGNRDVLVLVTDTPHEAGDEALQGAPTALGRGAAPPRAGAEEALQAALADIPTMDALALVAGIGDAIIDSEATPAGAHQGGAGDPAGPGPVHGGRRRGDAGRRPPGGAGCPGVPCSGPWRPPPRSARPRPCSRASCSARPAARGR